MGLSGCEGGIVARSALGVVGAFFPLSFSHSFWEPKDVQAVGAATRTLRLEDSFLRRIPPPRPLARGSLQQASGVRYCGQCSPSRNLPPRPRGSRDYVSLRLPRALSRVGSSPRRTESLQDGRVGKEASGSGRRRLPREGNNSICNEERQTLSCNLNSCPKLSILTASTANRLPFVLLASLRHTYPSRKAEQVSVFYHLGVSLDQLSDSPAWPFMAYLVLLRAPEHL